VLIYFLVELLSMEAFPILLFAFLAVCKMPSALGFECYACWNVPWSEDNRCDSDGIRKVTCPRYYYRCYTMKFTMIHEGKTMHVMRRNCTSSLACDPKTPDISMCTHVKQLSGYVSDSCEAKCCQENLCDPYEGDAATTAPVPAGPASAVPALAASFGAILVAFVLNMFAGFN